MKTYILTIAALLALNLAYAQDFFDALRYSQTEYGGTARSISMGSAFGALGGDFVSASINPAGLGLYRSGELSLSTTLQMNSVQSDYLGTKESDVKYTPMINNLSYVASIRNKGAHSNFVIGFGFNKLKNFDSNIIITKQNAQSSMLDYFTDYSNDRVFNKRIDLNEDINAQIDPILTAYDGDYYEGLAWRSDLLVIEHDENGENIYFWNDLNIGGYGHSQEKRISRRGKIDEYIFSFAANFNHRLNVGFTLGLHDVFYEENSEFLEYDNEGKIDFFNNYQFDEYQTTKGYGYVLKFGSVYRPTKNLRLGASLHTPTFYALSTEYDTYMYSEFDNGDWFENLPENIGLSEHRIETPFKFIFSSAYSFKEKAIISIDYEYLDYASTKIRNNEGRLLNNNHLIEKHYKATSNIRIGTEINATPNVSLRAGYGRTGNPWKDNITIDGITTEIFNKNDKFNTYSAGIGYRQQSFFIDFAYRLYHSQFTQKVHEIYYTNPNQVTATSMLTQLNNQATITLGFRF